MSPQHSDALLGGLWNCDLDEDARRDSLAQVQELLDELVGHLDAPATNP